MNSYLAQRTAAVTYARQSPVFQQYRRMGANIAASIHLADRFGTWVAYDAYKCMGMHWWGGNMAERGE